MENEAMKRRIRITLMRAILDNEFNQFKTTENDKPNGGQSFMVTIELITLRWKPQNMAYDKGRRSRPGLLIQPVMYLAYTKCQNNEAG
jgi:hypothetical protein